MLTENNQTLLSPPRQLARLIREKILKKVRPNLVLNARLNARLLKDYQDGKIRTVFDIGAHKGHWATGLKTLMPDARIILFEANPNHTSDLKLTGLEHFVGLLSKPGTLECDFYSPHDSAGSTGGSYYREVTPEFRNIDSMKLEALTLQDIVNSKKLPQPDLIKIDTQGSELDVMEGGEEIFRKARLILMELPTIQYNSGAPDISSYLNRMNQYGFIPIDVTEVHHYGDVVIQLDFLFANKNSIPQDLLKNLHQ